MHRRHRGCYILCSVIKKKAFTLIELLVVVAIIAVLLSVIIPALNGAKRQATAAVCLANENQLSMSWHLYAGDNDDLIVEGQPEYSIPADGFTDYGIYGKAANFVTTPINATNSGKDWSLEGRIRGFEKGGVWPYFENYKLYHCPADKRSAKDELRYGYRTYSIGAVYSRYALLGGLTGTWTTGEDKVAVIKTLRISSPSSKFVWLEEMDIEQRWNNNMWNIFLGERKWGDPLAVWHGDSSTFGFADGHAERHKWAGKEVKTRGNFDMAIVNPALQKISAVLTDPKDIEDWNWVVQHYIPIYGLRAVKP